MPTAHGISVFLEDSDGNQLTEYGTHHPLPSKSTGKLVTTNILCKDDMQFIILIGSEEPFPTSNKVHNLRPLASRQAKLEHAQAAVPKSTDGTGEPFMLEYQVFIDGNEVQDCGVVSHVGYDYEFHGQWRNTPDGVIESRWIFSSVGIARLMETMDIENDEDKMFTKFEEINVVEEQRTAKERLKRQIEVRVTRCTMKPTAKTTRFAGDETSNEVELETKIDNEATHEVKADYSTTSPPPLEDGEWATAAFEPGEQCYATFRFYYMGLQKLYNLGWCEMDGKPRKTRRRESAVVPQVFKRGIDEVSGPSDNSRLGDGTASSSWTHEDQQDGADMDGDGESSRDRAEKRRAVDGVGSNLVLSFRPKAIENVEAVEHKVVENEEDGEHKAGAIALDETGELIEGDA